MNSGNWPRALTHLNRRLPIKGNHSPVDDLEPIHSYNAETVHVHRDPVNRAALAPVMASAPGETLWAYLANAYKTRNTGVGCEIISQVIELACPATDPTYAHADIDIRWRVLPPVNATTIKANLVYAITGLGRNVAHTLADKKVLSTPVGTVFFIRYDQPKYTYAVSLVGLTCRAEEASLPSTVNRRTLTPA
jgi:hypothetical protein